MQLSCIEPELKRDGIDLGPPAKEVWSSNQLSLDLKLDTSCARWSQTKHEYKHAKSSFLHILKDAHEFLSSLTKFWIWDCKHVITSPKYTEGISLLERLCILTKKRCSNSSEAQDFESLVCTFFLLVLHFVRGAENNHALPCSFNFVAIRGCFRWCNSPCALACIHH